MVKTVEKLTGLKINHYVEINFIGFQSLVNALDGIPICIRQADARSPTQASTCRARAATTWAGRRRCRSSGPATSRAT